MTLPALQTRSLGRRYGSQWALRDCTLHIPSGRIAALVGPNGAGKTTLLHMAAGLDRPSSGSVRVFGLCPQAEAAEVLPRLGFVAQERPLFRGFTVAEMLIAGRRLNPRWDIELARRRMRKLELPLGRKVGNLSGGQQAQVALVMALAKRPDLLLLDEPVAALDPLARREFLRVVLEVAAEDGVTVLLSSHIVGDLERSCDYLIMLSTAQLMLAGEIDEIVASHRLLIGSHRDPDAIAHLHTIVHATQTERQTTVLVRVNGHIWDPAWEVKSVSLEDIILAYLGRRAEDETAPVEQTVEAGA
jgi:ABC-2 type transport system ATP-binding protein